MKDALLILLINCVLIGCKEKRKEEYSCEEDVLPIRPEDLLNHRTPSKKEIIYNIYELQFLIGNVIQDTLTFDEGSNYINDRLTVYADKVVYARILKDSVIVL